MPLGLHQRVGTAMDFLHCPVTPTIRLSVPHSLHFMPRNRHMLIRQQSDIRDGEEEGTTGVAMMGEEISADLPATNLFRFNLVSILSSAFVSQLHRTHSVQVKVRLLQDHLDGVVDFRRLNHRSRLMAQDHRVIQGSSRHGIRTSLHKVLKDPGRQTNAGCRRLHGPLVPQGDPASGNSSGHSVAGVESPRCPGKTEV
jgi:hypothetical protein